MTKQLYECLLPHEQLMLEKPTITMAERELLINTIAQLRYGVQRWKEEEEQWKRRERYLVGRVRKQAR